MAGRPPKPSATRKAEGNPGKRPIPHEPTPPPPATGEVLPPEVATAHWVDGGIEVRLWDEFAAILAPMGLLTTASAHALAQLCEAYAEYIGYRAAVDEDGATYRRETDRGGWSLAVNPAVSAAADAWRRVLAMIGQFGLTPAALAKVGVHGEQDVDPFAEFDGPQIADGKRAK